MNHRLGFGVFLAPHHPIGEHPTLQLERDLELGRMARPSALRRVLGRRASLRRMGNHRRRPRCSSSRRRDAHQAHPPRHRRRVDSVSSSVQRRAAHRSARPYEPRPRDAGRRPGRASLRRVHARDRSDHPARSDGRRPRRDPAPAQCRRAVHLSRDRFSNCTMRRCRFVRSRKKFRSHAPRRFRRPA